MMSGVAEEPGDSIARVLAGRVDAGEFDRLGCARLAHVGVKEIKSGLDTLGNFIRHLRIVGVARCHSGKQVAHGGLAAWLRLIPEFQQTGFDKAVFGALAFDFGFQRRIFGRIARHDFAHRGLKRRGFINR